MTAQKLFIVGMQCVQTVSRQITNEPFYARKAYGFKHNRVHRIHAHDANIIYFFCHFERPRTCLVQIMFTVTRTTCVAGNRLLKKITTPTAAHVR